MFSNTRNYSITDHFISHLDKCIRTLLPTGNTIDTQHPGSAFDSQPMSETTQKQVAGLMRVNHSGEVCAQALYIGQSVTARNASIKESLKQAAEEEVVHLAWCSQRLHELGAKTSYLNPVWFIGSLSIGILAGLAGDKVSLGFLHETENQVITHLNTHLNTIPLDDQRTRAILEQMKIDEAGHATLALEQGAAVFPIWIKTSMQLTSKIMTTITYYI